MRNDINELVNKYKSLIKRIDEHVEMFPEEKATLMTRKNVYMDMVLDLKNILELHKEDVDETN